MGVFRIDGMGAALPSWVQPVGVSSFGRAPVGVSSFGRTPVPSGGGLAPVVKPSPAAAPSRVSSSVALVGKASGFSLAPAPRVDCGPPPPGAAPDDTGAIRFSVDPKVIAWRNCDRANAAPAPAAAAPPPYVAPATPLGPYVGPGAPYESPSKSPDKYSPDDAFYASGGGGAPSGPIPAGPLTKGFSSDVADDVNKAAAAVGVSSAVLVAGGVAAAAVVGVGLWLAFK